MKNNSFGTKLLMGLVTLAVAAYFGFQLYESLADPLITAVAYAYEVEDTLALSGYVARDEVVLPDAGSGLLRLTRSEGERVSAGGRVAQIYADQASLDRQTEIDRLQTQLDQLEYAAQESSGAEAALQLDSQITQRLMTVRRALAADKLDAAENSVAELKALVLRRDYTYTDAEELKAQTAEIQSQLKALKGQSAGSLKTVTAPRAGVYSAVVDGYESVLTPETVETLTPSAISALQAGGETSRTGKLVLGDAWYYVASLSASDAKQLTEGSRETLRFAKGVDRDLSVTVQSVGQEENGRVAAVFRGAAYLSELTLLRRQSADLILSTASGIRVPQEAIRVDEEGVTGVYCVVGANARFKPVTLLWSSDEGYAVVRAEGTDTRMLRPGDQVILTAGGLTDGAVVGTIS